MRQGPPFGRRILYGLFLVRLGPQWKEWVERDVARPSFVFWAAATDLVVLAAVAAVVTALGRFRWGFAIGFLLFWWGRLLFASGRRFARERHLNWQRRKWAREGS